MAGPEGAKLLASEMCILLSLAVLWWLPRKTKEAAPLDNEADSQQADSQQGKKLTKAQFKQAEKLLDSVKSLVDDLEKGLEEGEKEEYEDELPPSMVPKIQDRACVDEGGPGSHRPLAGRGLAGRLQGGAR